MSTFTYNDITLPYAMTSNFRQEAVYDDVGQTDWCKTKYDIEVQAVVNSSYLSLLAPSLVGVSTNPAYIMASIRNQLLQPRRRLSVQINGVELIPQNNLSGSVDADNGPKPQTCIINQLGDVTFLITYHIIAHYWETQQGSSTLTTVPTGGSQSGNSVLFNRWSESVDIDGLNMSTRTREGKFVIRSDNNVGVIADQVRKQMAVVGVPTDFLRASSSYRVDPSGLAVTYRIVDREQFKMPPNPAYEAEGWYQESTPRRPGVQRYAEVYLRLRGAKNVSQSKLLQTAVLVCTTKLANNGAPFTGPIKGQAILENGSIKVDMYKNEVEVNLRAFKSINRQGPLIPIGDGKGRFAGTLAHQWEQMCRTPQSEQGQVTQPFDYPPHGTAGLLMQAAAYYDPALQNTVVNQATGQLSAGQAPGTTGVNPE